MLDRGARRHKPASRRQITKTPGARLSGSKTLSSLGGLCASITPRYQTATFRPVRPPVLPAYLKKGGDPNVRYRGLPALMWAARCGQLRVLEMLLDAGCDIQPMHGNDGNTALHRAAANGHLDVECRHFGGSLPHCHLALQLGNLCLQGSFQRSNGSPDSSGPATRSRTRHDVSLHECGGLNNVQCSLFVTDVYVLVRLRHEFFLKQHR
eukprot:COSAG06_NODE_7828_length_2362_cov_2.340698_3_plen_209_part_00